MSVSTISKFWERSSMFFRVLVVCMFMVAIGVSNFVGASLFAEDKLEIDDSFLSESDTETENHIKTDELSASASSKDEDNTSMLLYSIEPDFNNNVLDNNN